MNDEELFLGEEHPKSGRTATFEDDGTSAWLYLSERKSPQIAADAWVFNRIPAPKSADIEKYRGGPPPAAKEYAGPRALCANPADHDWQFLWSADGESVAILQDGIALAMIAKGKGPGFSRHLKKSGPWGRPWDEVRYQRVIEQNQ